MLDPLSDLEQVDSFYLAARAAVVLPRQQWHYLNKTPVRSGSWLALLMTVVLCDCSSSTFVQLTTSNVRRLLPLALSRSDDEALAAIVKNFPKDLVRCPTSSPHTRSSLSPGSGSARHSSQRRWKSGHCGDGREDVAGAASDHPGPAQRAAEAAADKGPVGACMLIRSSCQL